MSLDIFASIPFYKIVLVIATLSLGFTGWALERKICQINNINTPYLLSFDCDYPEANALTIAASQTVEFKYQQKLTQCRVDSDSNNVAHLTYYKDCNKNQATPVYEEHVLHQGDNVINFASDCYADTEHNQANLYLDQAIVGNNSINHLSCKSV